MRLLVLFFLIFSLQVTAQTSYQDAEMLFIKQEFNKAKTIFLSNLKVKPNHLKTIEYLGDIAGHQKQWDLAIHYYQTLVDNDEKNANYHYKLGGVLGMKSLSVNKIKALTIIDDVEYHFLKAAALDSKHIDTRWALVQLYIKLPGIIGGSIKKALKYADELKALSLVDGYLAKGFVYDYKNDFQKSEQFYKQAVEVGGSVTCYQKLIDLYVNNNQKEKAISTLEEAHQTHQKNDFLLQLNRLKN